MAATKESLEREEALQGIGCSRKRKEDPRFIQDHDGSGCAIGHGRQHDGKDKDRCHQDRPEDCHDDKGSFPDPCQVLPLNNK